MSISEHYEYKRFADIKRLVFIEKALMNLSKKSRILDVGCGNGIISRHLGKLGFNVLGIDVDEKAIDYARKSNRLANVRFEIKNADQLDLNEESFDVIICSEVLEHLNHPGELLKTLNRLLKDDGIMIVTVPNGYGPREVLVTKPVIFIQNDQFAGRLLCRFKKVFGYDGKTIQSASDNLRHIQFFSQYKLRSLAKENMFKITSINASNFIDDIFPVSLVARNSLLLQKIDARIADFLPVTFTGGFLTIWKKTSAS